MKFYCILATLQPVILTNTFLNLLNELNIFAEITEQNRVDSIITHEELESIHKNFTNKVCNSELDTECILYLKKHSLLYLWKKHNVVIKRIPCALATKDNIEAKSTSYNHKNVVNTFLSFYQHLSDEKILWLVMEPLHIELPVVLQLDDDQAKSMAFDLISGLNFLHLNDIAHLDISPNNIMATRVSLQNTNIDYKSLIKNFVVELNNCNTTKKLNKLTIDNKNINNKTPSNTGDCSLNEFDAISMNQRFNEASMNNNDNILGTINNTSLSNNDKTFSNQDLSSVEIPCVDNIEISLEIFCLKPKKLHAKKHLFIVLTNGKGYVTYDKILNNELVIKVTPYKNTILEMLSLIEPTLSTKQFTYRTKDFIIYNYDAYNNINIRNKNENEIEIITKVKTKNFLGKLDSILQDSELVFKIIDFDYSRIIVASQDGNKTNNWYGTNPYVPPEIYIHVWE
ncbi:Cyclin-dependent kinase 6 [Conglomerata obtusa]